MDVRIKETGENAHLYIGEADGTDWSEGFFDNFGMLASGESDAKDIKHALISDGNGYVCSKESYAYFVKLIDDYKEYNDQVYAADSEFGKEEIDRAFKGFDYDVAPDVALPMLKRIIAKKVAELRAEK